MRPQKNYFKKILVVRTDRIGDVVLSTPVLKGLRDNFPQSHIAVMVSPQAREIVEDNPYINEVIVYDKDKKDKGLFGFWRFALDLKKKEFDLAIVLHTKKRTNLITYLADIPKRVGYHDKKFGFLLTDKIKDIRPLGLQHEVDYCLDILKSLGLTIKDRMPYVAVKKEQSRWLSDVLQEGAIKKEDRIAGIHPGASCISKRWLKDRFIVLANRLVEDYGVKIILLAQGEPDVEIANDIARNTRYPVLNLAGKTSLSQLVALLSRCSIFISNDSGPVHIASAVGTPVISIFGRNQAGLSPLRWGPVGRCDKYLHREVGCSVCLAHKCEIGFDCLKAITVEDVLKAVDDILTP
jgi:heptosyltransferase-2